MIIAIAQESVSHAGIGAVGVIFLLIYAIVIIALVLIIKLMRRGIMALDKYIEENQ